jgi:hypothetical protein
MISHNLKRLDTKDKVHTRLPLVRIVAIAGLIALVGFGAATATTLSADIP